MLLRVLDIYVLKKEGTVEFYTESYVLIMVVIIFTEPLV